MNSPITQAGTNSSLMAPGLFSSRSEEWETPQYVYDYLNGIFRFDIDVCASGHNAKHKSYFSKEDDALQQDWGAKSCFMNPPYGRKIIKFMEKAYAESRKNAKVVVLITARTDTEWFHKYASKAEMIWFIRGRISFGSTGEGRAPFPSCIIIFDKTIRRDSNDSPMIDFITIPKISP